MPVRDRFSRFSLAFAGFAMLAACSGGGGGSPNPNPTIPAITPTTAPSAVVTTRPTTSPTTPGSTAVPTTTPTTASNAAAFVCPTSNTVASVARGTNREDARRPVARFHETAAAPTLLEVTYATSTFTRSALATRESSLGIKAVHEMNFSAIGRTTRTVAVGSANPEAMAASLRSQAGVISVTAQTSRRHPMSVSAPYFTNDPYFNGFKTTVAPDASSTPPPATYHVGPYEETNNVPGQWNMHAVGLDKAFAYGQSGNGSGLTNAGALGNPSIKLAIIDTGADTTIPELSGKIVAQGCFITNPQGVQSTSNFVTDQDGHGTDTSAIAAANTGNGLGFAGAGGNVSLMEYRVNPTPDDACLDQATSGNDPQCSANVTDLADAVLAATNAGANVISLSLGGGGCANGVDQDSEEGNALANAFAKNVVVVASSGNDGANTKGSIAAPACVTGVIAAGASALADGTATGSGSTAGSPAAPVEYVASYSQYGTPSAAVRSANAWGIVAPGGDPGSAETGTNGVIDDLHWIIDAYTSTPVDANFAGGCHPDYPNGSSNTGTIDCRILIAGTSMSAPTIAGAAALILSANNAYQSPSSMKSLLCTTADDINDPLEGCGRLNVYRAMAKAVGDAAAP